MDLGLTIVIGALALGASISAALSFLSWKKRPIRGAVPLVILSLSVFVWQAGYALELASVQLPWGIRWAKFQYLGIVTIPVAWSVLIASYTGHTWWSAPKFVVWLSLLPLTTLALALTNEMHGLVWSDVVALEDGRFLFVHGPWFWIFAAYSYLLLTISVAFLSPVLTVYPSLYVRQASFPSPCRRSSPTGEASSWEPSALGACPSNTIGQL